MRYLEFLVVILQISKSFEQYFSLKIVDCESIEQLFKKCDDRKDGKLTQDEIKEHQSDEEAQLLFEKQDINKNNVLDKQEFQTVLQINCNFKTIQIKNSIVTCDKIKQIFITYDTNNNNYLDISEFSNMMNQIQNNNVPNNYTTIIFNKLDKNKDGKIQLSNISELFEIHCNDDTQENKSKSQSSSASSNSSITIDDEISNSSASKSSSSGGMKSSADIGSSSPSNNSSDSSNGQSSDSSDGLSKGSSTDSSNGSSSDSSNGSSSDSSSNENSVSDDVKNKGIPIIKSLSKINSNKSILYSNNSSDSSNGPSSDSSSSENSVSESSGFSKHLNNQAKDSSNQKMDCNVLRTDQQDKFDKDKDGQLNKSEFTELINQIGKYSIQDADKLFAKIDALGDGKIHMSELGNLFNLDCSDNQ